MRTALSLCLMALAGLGPVATANPVALSGDSGSIEMRWAAHHDQDEIVAARADVTPTTTSSTSATTTRHIPTNAMYTNILTPFGDYEIYLAGGSCIVPPKSEALENRFVPSDGLMSVQRCYSKASGSKFFGLRNGTECWYGDVFSTEMNYITDLTRCMVPCRGDPFASCGGKDGQLLLYERRPAGSPSFTVSVTAGSKTYGNPACYFHTEGTPALEHVTTSSTMTVEECVGLAAAQNAKYAGIEDGSQCWYGNVLPDTLTNEHTTNNCIWSKCAGNSLQYCGSVSRILMYNVL